MDHTAAVRKFPLPADDWWITGPGKTMCRKCGEERLTQEIIDFRGKQLYCQVCGHTRWLLGKDRHWSD